MNFNCSINHLPPVIAIDGTSSSGKGTLCMLLAKTLQWNILDSGAIYRTIDLLARYQKIFHNKEEKLLSIAKNLNISFKIIENHLSIMLGHKDISWDIRNNCNVNMILQISSSPKIREILLHYQRKFRVLPGLIADGRDMGTVVFPDAKIKIFLDANLEKRAQRRFQQLQKSNVNVTLREVLKEIKKRDYYDKHRKISPLIKTNDTYILDSTYLSINDVLNKVMTYIQNIQVV
ncbi:MAG: cytidylate kinase [Candidatus Westeberhardia cardiocondylae]|nr:cytidylate kinase [Candidatus Westeberhardia cardiocondylae]